MTRPAEGGSAAEIGPGRRGRAKKGRDVLGRVGCAVFGTAGKLGCRGAAGALDECAHLVEAGLQHLMGGGKAATPCDPPPGAQRGAPHQTRSPDVAVDAALIAKAVGEAGLAEQCVEFVLVRRRHHGREFQRCGHRPPRPPEPIPRRRRAWP